MNKETRQLKRAYKYYTSKMTELGREREIRPFKVWAPDNFASLFEGWQERKRQTPRNRSAPQLRTELQCVAGRMNRKVVPVKARSDDNKEGWTRKKKYGNDLRAGWAVNTQYA